MEAVRVVSVAEMRAIEQEANARGVTYALMMQRAGEGVAKVIQRRYQEEGPRVALGLVGSGNNGGDTLVALTHLAQWGWRVGAYLVRPRPIEDPLVGELEAVGGVILQLAEDPAWEKLHQWLDQAHVLLDGIFGTGVKLPLRGEVAELLGGLKDRRSLPPVVAVDCPSGVDCDTGEVDEVTLPAEVTVCMEAVKIGLLRFPAFEYVGELEIVPLGLPQDLQAWQGTNLFVAEAGYCRSRLPARPRQAHKGTFGTAMVVAGSVNYTGAVWLSAKAAYRIGAGLVRVALPGSLHPALAGHLPEATWVLLPSELGVIDRDAAEVVLESLERVTALLLGPGWGTEATTAEFLARLLGRSEEHLKRHPLGFVMPEKEVNAGKPTLPPCVVDADGLRLLAQLPEWWSALPPLSVLTPHPGEMSVLTGLSVAEIQANRLEIARRFSAQWGHVVVLKGALTVVAAPDGQAFIIPVANAALARAGSGDVLAGLVVGLLAQRVPPLDAAVLGAWVHGQAGLLAARQLGHAASVLAGDILEQVPEVLRLMSGRV
ncbi:NAD(P)H-hydrate dehydratase [uncultured Thermanaerothrix sp.]|uniref:NAD(P)H-hydrate dehydratase n=1 Tax=uncultured Thermanaerothrix sp. TaxID=1195149 RepID=UPI00262F2348|nr:NAD(P)H-hydrate dehydratase [uncultured Thermanaerothrix sp.]